MSVCVCVCVSQYRQLHTAVYSRTYIFPVNFDCMKLPPLLSQAAALLLALLSAIALVTFHPVNGYPKGAPQQACRTLKPLHRGGIPQPVHEGSLKLVINERFNGTWQEAKYYKPNQTYQGLYKLQYHTTHTTHTAP